MRYSLRIDVNPQDREGKRWMVVLAGADPRGVLYAVRDFCHYHFYKGVDGIVLRRGARSGIESPDTFRVRLQSVFGYQRP